MPNTTETVFVEFVVQDEQLKSTTDTLERTGKIDKQTADQFKKTNEELAKRQQIIDSLNKQLRETESQNAKTIGDLEKKVETFINDFVAGFNEGILESLNEAGIKFDEFGKVISKNNENVKKSSKDVLSPFEKLSKQLNDTKSKVLNIRTEMSRLSRTGGVGTEQFEKLGETLAQRESELKRFQEQYDQVTGAVKKNKEATDDNANAQVTLNKRLKEITDQLRLMKLAGEDNTEEYKQLVIEGGNLKDTLGDVSAEINLAAANSQKLNGLIQTAEGITGAFAIAQGTVGLFGAGAEELNETLLKVQSVMAVLQGLQSVNNVLQKESAASTFLNTAAQKIYNAVVGESIGLMSAFRIALAATGIGLLIIGIAALVQALDKANAETEEANRLLERNKNIIEADTSAIEHNTDVQIARANAINAKESEIIKIRGHGLVLQRAAIVEANELLLIQLSTLDQTSEAYFKLNQAVSDNASRIAAIDSKLIEEQINLDKQLKVERLQGIADSLSAQLAGAKKNSKNELSLAKQTARAKAAIDLFEAGDNIEKRLLIEANLQKEIRALDLEFARNRQESKIAAAENELLKVQQKSREINERVSQEEIDAEKKVINEKARLDLLQEGLSESQKTRIIKNALAQKLQLQKDFNKQSNEDVLNDLISRNKVEINQLNVSSSEKLRLQEENLIAAAQIEIDQNKGLADKIKAIRSQLNADIRALRLASLQKETEDELSLTESRTGALRRANERIASDETKRLKPRLAAINQLAALEIANINTRQDALDKSLRLNLISQKEYNIEHEKLKDEELKVVEDAELAKRALIKQTQMEALQFAADSTNQLLSIVQQFGQQQTDAEQIRIDEQKAEIDALRESGAITEKEAIARQKKLEQEEKTIKRRQAERDKSIAIFQAIINTAAAVARALATGGPVLAAIVGALGAAQIALIASKPIPKFGKGKKGSYTGPAEIGETGPELLQKDNEIFLAKSSALVWLGKRDKVFNPKETVAILQKGNMQPYLIRDNQTNQYKNVYNGVQIDYEKLGKVISQNIPQVGLNIDEKGFTNYVQYKNMLQTYLDNRRSY